MMCEKKIPKSVIERLPTYLHYLKSDMFKDNEMVMEQIAFIKESLAGKRNITIAD